MDRTGIARALAGAAAASIVYAVVDAVSPTLLDGVALTIVSGGLWIAAAIEWPLELRAYWSEERDECPQKISPTSEPGAGAAVTIEWLTEPR